MTELTLPPVDETLQRRVDELATRHEDGCLTPDELREYESYVQANNFISILHPQLQRLRPFGVGEADSSGGSCNGVDD